MGIDNLRLISEEPPCREFLKAVNTDIGIPQPRSDERRFKVQFQNPYEESVESATRCRIITRKGVRPSFYLQSNFSVGRRGGCFILDLNPNKLPEGVFTLAEVVEEIFGGEHPDLRISRVDLNAELAHPVDQMREMVRIPRKRKTTHYGESDAEKVQTFSDLGTTGFKIGSSPHFLRVYDKRRELAHLGRDLEGVPAVLTRFEWQTQHHKTPIDHLSEMEQLADLEPFSNIEFLENVPALDFRLDPIGSQKRLLLNELSLRYGRQEAVRICNSQRHFWRDYKDSIVDTSSYRDELQTSYLGGVQAFLEGNPVEWFLPDPEGMKS